MPYFAAAPAQLLTRAQTTASENKRPQMEKIRNLIASNRLPEALQALLEALPAHLKNDATALQTQLQALERNERLGMLSFSDASIRRANITNGALELIGQIGAPPPQPTPQPGPQPAPQPTPTQKPAALTKILFLAANPTDQARIQTGLEHRQIKTQLGLGSERDKFLFLPPQFEVTIKELVRAMNDKPNIVHFSGHGETNGISISTEKNTTQLVGTPALQRLFKPLKGTIKILILNACYSAEQAKAISEFGPYVVGHNLPVADPAAISFSEGFYNGLGEGKNFKKAFNDAMTVVLTEYPSAASAIEVWKDGQKLDL